MGELKQLEALAAEAEKGLILKEEVIEAFLDSVSTESLIKATRNKNDYVREWAVYALKNRTGKIVETTLIEVMEKDRNQAIKERAISSLSTRTSSQNVVQALKRVMEGSNDDDIGINVINALLGNKADKTIDEALIQALKNKDRSEKFGYTIISAL